MIICKTIGELNEALKTIPCGEKSVLVPTMGALHSGHLDLIGSAMKRSKYTIVTIFVNPTQFNNNEDFNRYPRLFEKDCLKLKDLGVFLLFSPSFEEIYPNGEDKKLFDLGGLDQTGEGQRRPGHFNGVAQIVTRLFDIIKPQMAFFGEKDFQQLAIIKFITKRLNYPIEIVPVATVREDNGLAMSSRNMLLTKEQLAVAPKIFEALSLAKSIAGEAISGVRTISPMQLSELITAKINSEPLLRVEYFEILNGETMQIIQEWRDAETIQACTAVYADPVRLIDNIKLK